ncbi:MAG: hypothetical protein ACRENL_04560 [Candidatus Dormibacteria bacterium]
MTSFDIRGVQGRRWAHVTIDQLSGGPGLGFYQLYLNLTLHVEAAAETNDPAFRNTPYTLTDLTADLRLGSGLVGSATASPQNLPVAPVDWTQDRSVQLRMELDRLRLEAIESARGGKDMQLALMFWVQLTDPSGTVHWQQENVSHLLTQSAWVQILEQLGYRKTMLLEVPVAPRQTSPELAAAATDLERAQRALERGDYRDAVGHCRDVMENISLALKDNDNIGFTDMKTMDKADRLRLLRRAFRTFTHPARHRDEVTVAIEWNRIDAVCAVSIAAALLTELSAPGAR